MTDSVSDDESTHSDEDETGNNPIISSNHLILIQVLELILIMMNSIKSFNSGSIQFRS